MLRVYLCYFNALGQFHIFFPSIRLHWVEIVENEWWTRWNKERINTTMLWKWKQNKEKQPSHKYLFSLSGWFPLWFLASFLVAFMYFVVLIVFWLGYLFHKHIDHKERGEGRRKNCLRFDNDSRISYFLLNKLNKNYFIIVFFCKLEAIFACCTVVCPRITPNKYPKSTQQTLYCIDISRISKEFHCYFVSYFMLDPHKTA